MSVYVRTTCTIACVLCPYLIVEHVIPNLLLKASTHLGSRQERGTLQDKSQPIRVQKGFLLNETTKIKRIIDRLTDRHHRHHRHHCRCDIIRFLDVIMHEVDVNRSHDNLKASGQVRSRGQREIKESWRTRMGSTLTGKRGEIPGGGGEGGQVRQVRRVRQVGPSETWRGNTETLLPADD